MKSTESVPNIGIGIVHHEFEMVRMMSSIQLAETIS